MNAPHPHFVSQASTRPLRLFLVEDSPAVRELLIDSLADVPNLEVAGFSETETEALQLLRQQPYDIIIFDIELREGNGISLLRSLAGSTGPQDSLKIIFSNNVSGAYRRVGAQYGVHHFFDKTTELPDLHAVVARATTEGVARGRMA